MLTVVHVLISFMRELNFWLPETRKPQKGEQEKGSRNNSFKVGQPHHNEHAAHDV